MNAPTNLPGATGVGKPMSPVRAKMRTRALRKEQHDAHTLGALAARKGDARDNNPFTGDDNVANRYAWFTGFDRP